MNVGVDVDLRDGVRVAVIKSEVGLEDDICVRPGSTSDMLEQLTPITNNNKRYRFIQYLREDHPAGYSSPTISINFLARKDCVRSAWQAAAILRWGAESLSAR